MYKLPKIATITIFILMIGLLSCVVGGCWFFSQQDEIAKMNLTGYLLTFGVIGIVAFFLGICFQSTQRSYTLMGFCGKIENTRIANNCILAIETRKKEINDGIPDYIKVSIVTPPAIKKHEK